MYDQIDALLAEIRQGINDKSIVKITLSGKRDKSAELKNIFIKLVQLKKGLALSFLYRYPTRDITKNLDPDTAIATLREALIQDFRQADLFGTQHEIHLLIDQGNQAKISRKQKAIPNQPDLGHNRTKNRIIQSENNVYLQALGVCSADGHVKSDMQDKYKQINKFVEIMDGILQSTPLPDNFSMVDMGSGKGYLTFALCDYLHKRQVNCQIIGVELREHLVEFCNQIAKNAQFDNLSFIASRIEDLQLDPLHVLIALHACDTATDDALFQGIRVGAKLVVCAPCCHKQIRKQINPHSALAQITRFGILAERQSEMLTDSLRALILEAYGYKTKIFEFISTEHTPKNVLIVAQLDANLAQPLAHPKEEKLKEIQALKELYGIKEHYLEKLLGW